MASNLRKILGSSVFRKQLSALTGLAMVGFVIGHLSGNLLIFLGPDKFNAYAHALEEMAPVLWVMRIGLILSLILHVYLTLTLARENTNARPQRYDVVKDVGDRKKATRAMKYTGSMIALFIILHLWDFTFGTKTGPSTVVEGVRNGEHLDLFGLVWNSFQLAGLGWFRVPLYIVAVMSVGLHLSHAIESVFQTFGFNHDKYTPVIKKISLAAGIIIGVMFASIPIYVALASTPFGV